MALIPPFFLDSVVALGLDSSQGKKRWVASAFLYGRFIEEVSEGKKTYHVYLVTNRHVLEGERIVYLRFNPRAAQPAKEYTLNLEDPKGNRLWFAHPDPEVDVATCPIVVKVLRDEGMQFAYFQNDVHVAERKKASDLGITEGDFVYVLGFPMGLIGGERNYVIARKGTIARIRDVLAGTTKEFLVDAFTFPGNSGGPVVTKPEVVSIQDTPAVGSAYLIGLVKSYIPYTDVAISVQTNRPRVTFEENSGLTAVLPIDFVEETISRSLESTAGRETGILPPSAQ
jgi:S1-C subfamily serine protease